MKISVCIGSVRWTTLATAITSVHQQTFTDWELVIVGQGPDPELRALGERASSSNKRIRYIHLDCRGLSHARNVGIECATGDIVAMTDDDCQARSDWLATLADCFTREPDVGLVGGAVIAPKPSRPGLATCPALHPAEALYDPVLSRRQAPRGWDWIGANFALRRDVAKQVGLFDECLGAGTAFPAGEDTDYKLRLEALGVRMRTTPRSVVYHTYGHRYGLRALLCNSRNYATGNGALAGKLTLLGDPRGQEWVALARREAIVDCLKQMRFHRLPVSLLRLRHYKNAYERCLRGYRVNKELCILQPIV